MGNTFVRCDNCGVKPLKLRFNYCNQCGYPSEKLLQEVSNPQEEIDRALKRPETLAKRIKYHGFSTVMREQGII